MSQYRSTLKKITYSKVPGHYNLNINDPDRLVRIEALLEDSRYIFPGDIMVCACCRYWLLLMYATPGGP